MIIRGKITKKDLKAIDIFANLLFSSQLKRHIEITIVYRKNVTHFGLTDIEEYNDRGIPRSFVVEIQRGLDETERLRTIAHEMVHHKQFEEGRLKIKPADIGGDIEDEANAKSGQFIKMFSKKDETIATRS
jgi:hypothetical protein